jgi:hypothetical protein
MGVRNSYFRHSDIILGERGGPIDRSRQRRQVDRGRALADNSRAARQKESWRLVDPIEVRVRDVAARRHTAHTFDLCGAGGQWVSRILYLRHSRQAALPLDRIRLNEGKMWAANWSGA